jgi:hypothetical protein
MKSKRNLMVALIGLAMITTPIVASAQDNDRHVGNNEHSWKHAAKAEQKHEWNHDRGSAEYRGYNGYNRGGYSGYQGGYGRYQGGYNGNGYSGYQGGNYNRGYRSGYSSSCANLQRQVARDRATGHPSAASDLANKMRNRCGGGFSGLGGLYQNQGYANSGFLAAPAYHNYGANAQPYGGGYNGGLGGLSAYQSQGYANNGYNGGGMSSLAPLFQNFIH